MIDSDALFVYEHSLLKKDIDFVDSVQGPRNFSNRNLSSFIDDLYELRRIKKTVSSFANQNSPRLIALSNFLLEKESQIKNYVDSSVASLAQISSSSSAKKNLALLSYFKEASSVVGYSSHGLDRLERQVLDAAQTHFSTSKSQSSVYYVGDVLRVDQELPVHKVHVYHSPQKAYSPGKKLKLFLTGAALATLIMSGAKSCTVSKKDDVSTATSFLEQEYKHNVHPVTQYEHHNIS